MLKTVLENCARDLHHLLKTLSLCYPDWENFLQNFQFLLGLINLEPHKKLKLYLTAGRAFL